MKNVFGQIRHDRYRTLTVLFIAVIFMCGVLAFAHPAHAISISERRKLAQLPKISIASILSGKYFSELETFMLDQFPWRDHFLRIKAFNQFYIYRLKDNHNIFVKNGTAVAISYPFTEGADALAAEKISALIDTWFQDMMVYVSIIPDKAYYLADKNGYPAIDYAKIQETITKGSAAAAYIDIFDTLAADDYYRTDSHWKQECLQDAVARLFAAMGRSQSAAVYEHHILHPFYGVYCGQSALPLKPDALTYLTSKLLDHAIVYRATENSKGFEKAALYVPEMIKKNDPFDLFLGGACSVVMLENPQHQGDKKDLYLFSDSFGRSIAPLLLEGYNRVYLIDIRYVRSSKLPELIQYQAGNDVLFLYSIETLKIASSLNTD